MGICRPPSGVLTAGRSTLTTDHRPAPPLQEPHPSPGRFPFAGFTPVGKGRGNRRKGKQKENAEVMGSASCPSACLGLNLGVGMRFLPRDPNP